MPKRLLLFGFLAVLLNVKTGIGEKGDFKGKEHTGKGLTFNPNYEDEDDFHRTYPPERHIEVIELSCPTKDWIEVDGFCVLETDKLMNWHDARDYCKGNYNSFLMELGADPLDDLNSIKIDASSFREGMWTSLNHLSGILQWDYFMPYPYKGFDNHDKVSLSLTSNDKGLENASSCYYCSGINSDPYREEISKNINEKPFINDDDDFCENKTIKRDIFIGLLKGYLNSSNFYPANANWELFNCLKKFLRNKNKTEINKDLTKVSLNEKSCNESKAFNCYLRPYRLELIRHYSRCPYDWSGKEYSKYCYNVSNLIVPYNTSAQWCRGEGENIVAPENTLQMKLIFSYLQDMGWKYGYLYLNFTAVGNRTYYSDGREMDSSLSELFEITKRNTKMGSCSYMERNNINFTSLGCKHDMWVMCQRPKLPVIQKKKETILEVAIRVKDLYKQVLECEGGQKYVWYKDSILIHQINEGKGSLRMSTFEKSLEQLQGRYECHCYDGEYNLLSQSFYNVVLTDIRTYILRVEYVYNGSKLLSNSSKYIPDMNDPELRKLFPRVFVPYGISVVNKRIVKRKRIKTGDGFKLTVEMTLFLNPNIHFSDFYNIQTQETDYQWFPNDMLYSENYTYKNEDVKAKNNFANIDSQEKLQKYDLLVKAIAKKAILRPEIIKDMHWIPESVQVQSSDRCLEKVFMHKDREVWFGYGRAGESQSSINKCPNADRTPIAEATCKGSREDGFSWVLDSVKCETNQQDSEVYKNILTKGLNDLLDNTITNKLNQDKAIKSLYKMTLENQDSFTAINLDIISEVLECTSKQSSSLSKHTGQNVVFTLNNILGVPEHKLQQAQDKFNTAHKLHKSVEELMSKVRLEGTEDNMTVVLEHIAVCVVKVDNSKNSTLAFGIVGNKGRIYNDSNSTGFPNQEYFYGEDAVRNPNLETSIEIPFEALNPGNNENRSSTTSQVNFIVYKNTKLFSQTGSEERCGGFVSDRKKQKNAINSMVVSSFVNEKNVSNLKEKIKITFKVNKNDQEDFYCMWSEQMQKEKGGSQVWSTNGLETKGRRGGKNNDIVECFSDHLTNFAVFAGFCMDPNSEISKILRAISLIGSALSLICLFLLIIFYIFASKKKENKSQDQIALINLAISLILLIVVLLVGVDRTDSNIPCMFVAALLHYLLLVSFAWMLVESVLQYYRFVKVFNTHIYKFKLKSTIPAWGIPAIIVLVTAAVDYKQFRGPQHYCWLAEPAFRYAFLLPLSLILLTNILIFIKIIKGITCDRPAGMKSNQSRFRLACLQLQVAICCFVVMGLTWTFALLAVGKAALVMQFLFAIFNSLQGFFIFILFNIRDKRARNAWASMMKNMCPCCLRQTKDNRYGFNKITSKSEESSSRGMSNTNTTKFTN